MKKIIVILLAIAFSLSACQNSADSSKEAKDSLSTAEVSSKKDSTVASSSDERSEKPFDYNNTVISEDFSDTAWNIFSDSVKKDCFSLIVPKGNIKTTTSTLRITNAKGNVIYEDKFATTDLIDGNSISDIKNDKEMEAYLLQTAKQLINQTFIVPAKLIAKPDSDFENLKVFMEA